MKKTICNINLFAALLIVSCNQLKEDRSKSNDETELADLNYVPIDKLTFSYTIHDSLVEVIPNEEGIHCDCLEGEIRNDEDTPILVLSRTSSGITNILYDKDGIVLEPLSLFSGNRSFPVIQKVPPHSILRIVELFESHSLKGKTPVSISIFTVNQFIPDYELRKNPRLVNGVEATKGKNMIVINGTAKR